MKTFEFAFTTLFATLFTATAQQPRWTVGMSQCNLGEPWRVQMNADIKKAAEGHPELRMIFKDAQNGHKGHFMLLF
jgi:ABC-type sugar transport system substrate-binding protein